MVKPEPVGPAFQVESAGTPIPKKSLNLSLIL
jgi:hypothetical protein